MLYDAREDELRDQLTRMKSEKDNGRAEGKVEGKAETICQFLEARFGVESRALQETVRTITDLDTLSRITRKTRCSALNAKHLVFSYTGSKCESRVFPDSHGKWENG